MDENKITVKTSVNAPISKVWEYWTNPIHINKWSFASSDWEASDAENDLKAGGKFKTYLSAKDKSAGFYFGGTYTNVVENKIIEYTMDDNRHVSVQFLELTEGVEIIETFDPENSNPKEMQQSGWQAFLDNFKKYVENS